MQFGREAREVDGGCRENDCWGVGDEGAGKERGGKEVRESGQREGREREGGEEEGRGGTRESQKGSLGGLSK